MGNNYILVGNNKFDGEIFIFDRKGKFITKFNHRGQGDKEYILMTNALLDEENREILINDPAARKIVVYSLEGTYKRTLKLDRKYSIANIYNFDKGNIICEVTLSPESNNRVKALIASKEDGNLNKEINVACDKIISTHIDRNQMMLFYDYISILPFQDAWLMTEASSDTIFKVSEDMVSPFIIKTPSVQSSKPEKFLFPRLLTNEFYFFEKVEKKERFIKDDLVYSIKDNSLYRYNIYNNDIKDETPLILQQYNTKNSNIGYWHSMDAYQLTRLQKEGKLQGKLKTITEKLDEDSNPIIVLLKNRID
ncbi:MAG: 6-bladed beta-propeller [Mediterranea massiliensis]|nr:6-bladed beta-propeller [Mediterranea massiliensis]